jgi:peptidylamidoglycolate lyase
VIIFSRGCLPELKEPGDVVPERNASGYDLSQKDPARHPRWDHIVNIVDRNGRLVESWEQHNKLFVRPHRIIVSPYDPERHIWLVDDGAQSIYKFTRDGKTLVMTLGEFRVAGNDEKHFGRPTDIAFLPDGTFFISDGYVNTRVVKFDRTGKYITSWGMRGNNGTETRPNYMNTVHAIVADKQGRLYVSDRANHRIQIFDQNGKFLDAWTNVPLPYSLLMTADQFLWSASGRTQKFTKYDLNGKLLASWGTFGAFPGGFWGVHQFHVDSEGNLYTADVHVGRPQKFRPRPGGNRDQLIGRPAVAVSTSTN